VSQQRITMQPAYVLHHRPYRETSSLLELLSESHGRVGAVARGARQSGSRWRGLLQPFTPLLVSWSGRGDLVTLTAAEAASPALCLPSGRVMSAWYANELLLRLLGRHDPQRAVFVHYATLLGELAANGDEAHALRVFEKRLLDALGYGLALTHDALTGEAVTADRHYVYRLERGPERVGVAEGDLVLCGRSLLALASEQLHDETELRDARRLLRAALDVYLGARPLKTREVVRAVRRRVAP
jgi:DNA repair protein RecO (recombination protein O)